MAESAVAESGDSGATDAAVATKAGFIGVTSYATEDPTVFTNSLSAGFNDGPGNTYGKGCQLEFTGACFTLICDLTDGGDQAPPPGAAQSAGNITIGGTVPTFSVAYDPGTMVYNAMPAVPKDKLIFAGGDTITFAAAGADVPAFAASIVAPTSLVATSPVLPSGTFSIETSKDLVFTWTGSSAGGVNFNVRSTTKSAGTTVSGGIVSCRFEPTALTGTIPAGLLQKLRKTDATTTAALTTDLSNTKEVVAGDHMVLLAVGSVITKADGKTPYKADLITLL